MKALRTLAVLGAACALAGCVSSSFETTDKLNHSTTETKIVALPVDVQLYQLDAGGTLEPDGDWTQSATKYLDQAMEEQEAAHHVDLVTYDEDKIPADERDEMQQVTKLFGVVASEIVAHQYVADFKLPSKADGFDWSLGPEVKPLHDATGADYALITYLRDSYATAGRVAVMVVGAIIGAAAGVSVAIPGGTQVGYAALVDLNTGDIVWFNRLARGSGDTRDLDGARGTATALLTNFPQ
jgi:hypothetical protein